MQTLVNKSIGLMAKSKKEKKSGPMGFHTYRFIIIREREKERELYLGQASWTQVCDCCPCM